MEQAKPLDTTAAEAYENYIVPAFMRPLLKDVIDTAAPQPGEHVLDVACGTGIVARLVAPRIAPGGTVSNLDFDPAMLVHRCQLFSIRRKREATYMMAKIDYGRRPRIVHLPIVNRSIVVASHHQFSIR